MTILLPLDEIVLQQEPRGYLYRKKLNTSVTGYIDLAGLGPNFSAVPPDRLERAQERGNKVHQCLHYLNENDLNIETVDTVIKGYVKGYQKFISECRIQPIAIEKKLVDPEFLRDAEGNPIGLGGTPDLVCWLNGRRAMIDYKTCAVLSKSTALQLMGYKLLWEKIYPNFLIYEWYSLKLKPDGTYKLVRYEDIDDHRAFIDLMRYVDAKKRMQPWELKYAA